MATAWAGVVGGIRDLNIGLRLVGLYDVLGLEPGRLRPIRALDGSRQLFRRDVAKRRDPCSEACFDQLRVSARQRVLGGQAAVCPDCGIIGSLKTFEFGDQVFA